MIIIHFLGFKTRKMAKNQWKKSSNYQCLVENYNKTKNMFSRNHPLVSRKIESNESTKMQNAIRSFSSQLTHVDNSGRASMVNVGGKAESERTAIAMAKVVVGKEVAELIADNNIKKGDVLVAAELAGVLGAKHTWALVPLCHTIILSHVEVRAQLVGDVVELVGSAKCVGRTGVEMEALTAVTIAALTVYDMCKSVSHNIVITDVKLLSKTGGSKGNYLAT